MLKRRWARAHLVLLWTMVFLEVLAGILGITAGMRPRQAELAGVIALLGWVPLLAAVFIMVRHLRCPVCKKRFSARWSDRHTDYCSNCGSAFVYDDETRDTPCDKDLGKGPS